MIMGRAPHTGIAGLRLFYRFQRSSDAQTAFK